MKDKILYTYKGIAAPKHYHIDANGLLVPSVLSFNIEIEQLDDIPVDFVKDKIQMLIDNSLEDAIFIVDELSNVNEQNDRIITTPAIEVKAKNIIKSKSQNYEDALINTIAELIHDKFNQKEVKLKSITPIFNIAVQKPLLAMFISTLDIHKGLSPEVITISITKMQDDYNPNCDTCKGALVDFINIAKSLSKSIFYSDEELLKSGLDYYAAYSYSARNIKSVVNYPVYKILSNSSDSDMVTLKTIADDICMRYKDLLNLAKIEELSFITYNNISYIRKIEAIDMESVLL